MGKCSVDGDDCPLDLRRDMLKRGFCIRVYDRSEILRIDGVSDWMRAPGAIDGGSVGLRGRPEKQAFCSDDVAAGKFARELS